jgi:glycosyltransferase involved in cell wall biosynthesis
LGVPADTILIGGVGSLIPRKGYDILLRAAAQLGGDRPPHVMISGGGPEREALEALAAELGITNRTHFLGYHDPIIDVYQTCDIFALASRADAFGLVFAEAGYFGRPVATTYVGGVPEVVLNEQTGLLTQPDDPDAFAVILKRLVEDADLRKRLGDAGQTRAETVFSAQRMASEFMDEYERLARLPRGGLGWGNVSGRLGPYFRMFRAA